MNSSQSPWQWNIDLSLGKTFSVMGLSITLYAEVLNLLNSRTVTNVYPSTGSPDEDGFLSSLLARYYVANVKGFPEFYRSINRDNRWAYMTATGGGSWYNNFSEGKDTYGSPRQVRFGLRVEL